MKSTSQIILFAISAIFSLVAIIFIFNNIDWKLIQALFAQVRWHWVGLSFAAYFLNLRFRTARFKILLQTRAINNFELLTVTSVHNMFNYLLPARSGELSYLVLIKNRLKLPLAEGTVSLFASRIFDILATTIILLLVLPIAWTKLPEWMIQSSLIYSAIVFIACAAIFILVNKVETIDSILPSHRWLSRLTAFLSKVFTGLKEIQQKKVYFRVGTLTVGIWACLYSNYFIICRALNFPVDYFQVILVSLVIIPLSVMPVQGFADLGTHEIAWVTILMVFGTNYSTAIDIAVGTHFLVMTNILFFGTLSAFTLQILSRKKYQR